MILLLTLSAIFALGYAAVVTTMRYRPSADDRASWPYALWISLQWPRIAWAAAPVVWSIIKAEVSYQRMRRQRFRW